MPHFVKKRELHLTTSRTLPLGLTLIAETTHDGRINTSVCDSQGAFGLITVQRTDVQNQSELAALIDTMIPGELCSYAAWTLENAPQGSPEMDTLFLLARDTFRAGALPAQLPAVVGAPSCDEVLAATLVEAPWSLGSCGQVDPNGVYRHHAKARPIEVHLTRPSTRVNDAPWCEASAAAATPALALLAASLSGMCLYAKRNQYQDNHEALMREADKGRAMGDRFHAAFAKDEDLTPNSLLAWLASEARRG